MARRKRRKKPRRSTVRTIKGFIRAERAKRWDKELIQKLLKEGSVKRITAS